MFSQYQPKVLKPIMDLHKSKNGYQYEHYTEFQFMFRIYVLIFEDYI